MHWSPFRHTTLSSIASEHIMGGPVLPQAVLASGHQVTAGAHSITTHTLYSTCINYFLLHAYMFFFKRISNAQAYLCKICINTPNIIYINIYIFIYKGYIHVQEKL